MRCIQGLFLAMLAASGCVRSSVVMCGEDVICPADTVCYAYDGADLCLDPDAMNACRDLAEGAACGEGVNAGVCADGVCLPLRCGDGVRVPGEACDDGNRESGDGCDPDCHSTEQCGNGFVDVAVPAPEECDDGNFIDHDGCSSSCTRESLVWEAHAVAPRNSWHAASAYDARRDRVVMFGGIISLSSTGATDQLWEWTGRDWVHRYVGTAPPPRSQAAAAFDAARGDLVIFGGGDGARVGVCQTTYADTWTWNGAKWTLHDSGALTGRCGAQMVYDSRRKRIVLFGGVSQANAGGSSVLSSETWIWNGAWTRLATSTSPPARFGSAMAYDPRTDRIVMVGGWSGQTSAPTFVPTTPLNDTWVFDGTDWRDAGPTGLPTPLADAHAIYDFANERLLLYGGFQTFTPVTHSGGLYEWTTSGWRALPTGTAPVPRAGAVLAATPAGPILFGGSTSGPESPRTWTLKGSTWEFATEPSWSTGANVTYDTRRARSLALIGGETWELSELGPRLLATSGPNARRSACFAYDPVRDQAVLFGGIVFGSPPTLLADTWVFANGTWSQKSTRAITPRHAAACAFDGTRITMFSGANSSTNPPSLASDAWSWDGADWQTASTFGPGGTLGPGARNRAASILSPTGHAMSIAGGTGTQGQPFSDAWTFDDTTWQPDPLPVSLFSGAMIGVAYAAANDRNTFVTSTLGVLQLIAEGRTGWSRVMTTDAPETYIPDTVTSTARSGGIMLLGGSDANLLHPEKRWEVSYQSERVAEVCDDKDLDGDGLVGCDDPDCWWVCHPACPPYASCAAPGQVTGPRCGDGVCDGVGETCQTCPADCACTAKCGDLRCDASENATSCPGDCP